MKKIVWLIVAMLAFGVTACSGGSATTANQEPGTGLSGVQADVHQAPG